jgi:hypothetical protein
MKSLASTLVATLIAVAAAQASAAPQVAGQTATLNASAAQAHHIANLHKYGGPKANPGVVKGGVQGGGANAVAQFDIEPCGNGKKPIPGVGPIPGGAAGVGGAGLAMSDMERCGTRVPGRIPGGVPTPR